MIRTRPGLLLGLAAAVLLPSTAAAQVAYPASPDKYDAHIRYRIRADRDERIRQFRTLTAFLDKLGFVPAAREDADLDMFDPTAELFHGTVPSANAARLLNDPRIQTVLLLPPGNPLPDDGKKLVPVRIAITSGLSRNEQRELHEQVIRHLGLMGFVPAVGYDHRGFSLVRGSLPAENVFRLLKDLRTQPTGWFAPAIPPDRLPLPLRAVLPIRLVEVLPDLPAEPAAPPAPPAGDNPALAKLTPDVLAVLADQTAQAKELRVDVILDEPPGAAWPDIVQRVRLSADAVSIEGLVGVVVSVRLGKAADVVRLAASPLVRSVRLPRAGSETGQPLGDPSAARAVADVLRDTRVADLHARGYRGRGTRLVVVASEFPAAEGLAGRGLPASTRFVDLTAELHPDLLRAEPTTRPGTGTVAAVIAHAAAPEADLILVRVDPAAFHQLLTVARTVANERGYSEAMQSRSADLIRRTEILAARRRAVSDEYREAMSNLSDEEGPTARRKAAREAFDKLIADEQALTAAIRRFTALKDGVDSLRGAGVVVNTLVWDTGFPQDGLSELSRYLEAGFFPKAAISGVQAERMPPTPVWVQPASTAVGQVWAGPYLDDRGAGAMEFAPPTAKLPAGRWTRELNFLGFRPATGAGASTLPAGWRLRVSAQWREPLDPDGFIPRDSVFPLTLRLLRQVDPTGKTAASDELVEVARTTGPPVRLLKTAGSAAFEQTLEVTIPADGVYALRVEGGGYSYPLPAMRQQAELYPRLVVEAADAGSAAKGHPVFATFVNNAAGVGIPGDSAAAVTVGVTPGPDGPRTLSGAGPGVALRVKPELYLPGAIAAGGVAADGSAAGAAFAAGTAASLLSAGVRAADLHRSVGLDPGKPLVLPSEWVGTLAPRRER